MLSREFASIFWVNKINLCLECNYVQIATAKYVKQIIPLRRIKCLTNHPVSLFLSYSEAKFTHSEVHWYWVCISVSLTNAFTCVANTDSGIDHFHHPSKFPLVPFQSVPTPIGHCCSDVYHHRLVLPVLDLQLSGTIHWTVVAGVFLPAHCPWGSSKMSCSHVHRLPQGRCSGMKLL